nr:thioredoxin domain-containing protein 3 isoform X5 [Bubalus bubalis]
MAGKKREIQLQAVVNNQSLWDEMMQNKGLTVIDVYQAWCGPCKAMQTVFRKLKNELNEDELLHFAVAEADSIVTLQPFRDKCEPVFLFSVNGTIVAKIQGANAPLVNQKIIALVNEEKKIAAGEMVRPQYHEIVFVDSDSEDAGELNYESVDQIYTIVIIKPDAVAARKVQEIKEKIIKAGFVIEAEDKKPLTEEQVKHFYSQIVDQPDFEDFVSFMTRNLSYILVVSQAKEKQPSWDESEVNSETESKELWDEQQEMAKPSRMKERKSLQQYLEIQQISQFCDVEENITNTKFIDVLIPDFKKIRGIKFEKILALLRPALVNERTEDVLNKIQDEGFKILLQRQIVLSEEEAKTLCKEYENKDYFGNVIENMTSGPSLALVLVRENGLGHWKQLIGPSNVEEAKEYLPECLCAQFAIEGLPINQLYGSDSLEAAEREIQYFFPPQHTVALIKPHVTQEQRGVHLWS